MLRLDVKSELPQMKKWLNEYTKQLPFSASQALNGVAGNRAGIRQFPEAENKGVLADIRRILNSKLDRPKKQTSEGFYATTAKKTALFVKITPKNKPWNRNSYIIGNIIGGDRPSKWIENTAQKLGSLPRNIDLVPTHNVERDNYGNPKRARINRAFKGVGSGKTIIGRPQGTQRPLGIYEVESNSVKALFVEKPTTNYPTPLQGLERMAMARASMTFGPYLRRALEKNVKAAKKK